MAVHGVARFVIATLAGVAAGVANGIAGGGSFFSFPVLLALGLPALTANVSSSVGVLPSYLPGIAAFRRELADRRALIARLLPACVAGSLLGTALLLRGTSAEFRTVVPYLIGLATVGFAAQPLLVRLLRETPHDHPTRRLLLHGGVFAIAVYGGYFGAGLGIMLLAVTGLALPDGLGPLSGLRSALSIVINLAAAIVFILWRHLAWDMVWCLLAGTFVGGILGTRVVLTVSTSWLRGIIIAIGVATTIRLAL